MRGAPPDRGLLRDRADLGEPQARTHMALFVMCLPLLRLFKQRSAKSLRLGASLLKVLQFSISHCDWGFFCERWPKAEVGLSDPRRLGLLLWCVENELAVHADKHYGRVAG